MVSGRFVRAAQLRYTLWRSREGGGVRVRRINNLSRAGGGEAAGQMSGGVVEVSDEVFAADERGDGAVILAWLTGRCCARSNMQAEGGCRGCRV